LKPVCYFVRLLLNFQKLNSASQIHLVIDLRALVCRIEQSYKLELTFDDDSVSITFMALYAGSNAYSQWKVISDWARTTAVMNIILGFCGILLAYWVYVDDDRINELERKLQERGD